MDLSLRAIIILIKQYRWEVFLSICLFSNLYPQLPPLLYYMTWAGLILSAKKTGAVRAGQRASLSYALMGLIFFSTLINNALFDYRWIMMCVILYITLCKTSYEFYRFKDDFMFASLFGYLLTGPLNWYAHSIGHNEALTNLRRKYGEVLFTIDFSGYTNHPMWLSAACGIGVIFIAYWANVFWRNGKKLFSLLCLPLAYITIQTLIWGGSRSALGLSLCASLLFIWLSNKKAGNSVLIIGGLLALSSILAPILLSDADRLKTKLGGLELQDKEGKTSRTALWNARLEEFESSPIWGVGFAVTGLKDQAHTGRAETGSGWLTVLSQTGLIGLLLSLFILKRAYIPTNIIRGRPRIALYTSILVYLCLHTMFEAYLFQSGWYLCLVMWLLISIIDDYKMYELENENEEEIEIIN